MIQKKNLHFFPLIFFFFMQIDIIELFGTETQHVIELLHLLMDLAVFTTLGEDILFFFFVFFLC